MLATEMKKIDESIREGNLSDFQRVKRQLRDSKVTEKDIEARLFEQKYK